MRPKCFIIALNSSTLLSPSRWLFRDKYLFITHFIFNWLSKKHVFSSFHNQNAICHKQTTEYVVMILESKSVLIWNLIYHYNSMVSCGINNFNIHYYNMVSCGNNNIICHYYSMVCCGNNNLICLYNIMVNCDINL